MNPEMQKIRDLFVENRNTIKGAFKWEDDLMLLAGSTLFTGLGLSADAIRLKECEEILKKHSGALSEFRGQIKMPLICKMAVSDNPELYLQKVTAIYGQMNKSKIGSSHKLLTAIILCEHVSSDDAARYIEKTNDIYRRMKETHKWLTSNEDIPFAAMLAVSGENAEDLIDEADRCYPVMKEKFGASNAEAVQNLCHVLALNKKPPEEKCKMAADIYDGLKEAKHKLGVGQELSYLGILTMLDTAAVPAIVEDISEIDSYLKKQKGFGDLSIGSSVRRMYASMIVMNAYQAQGGTNGIDNTLAVSVAIEISTVLMLTTLMILWPF